MLTPDNYLASYLTSDLTLIKDPAYLGSKAQAINQTLISDWFSNVMFICYAKRRWGLKMLQHKLDNFLVPSVVCSRNDGMVFSNNQQTVLIISHGV